MGIRERRSDRVSIRYCGRTWTRCIRCTPTRRPPPIASGSAPSAKSTSRRWSRIPTARSGTDGSSASLASYRTRKSTRRCRPKRSRCYSRTGRTGGPTNRRRCTRSPCAASCSASATLRSSASATPTARSRR
jgi:hypothetical protein